ncbi:MAG: glycoside hydrolase family 26 protein, partial [Treponema sp.]|nr:glycoside hydrolase family 26 protein [Treponema sp.]
MKNGCRLLGLLLILVAGCASTNSGGPERTARENKERLLEYLHEVRGKHILSGQMDTAWHDGIDPVARVYADTGRYPAIKGFDFLNVRHPDWGGGGSKQTRDAIKWWRNSPVKGKNGIVTFCWHWRMPKTGETVRSGRDNYTPGFVIPMKDGGLDKESPNFALIQEDLDIVAAELAKLRDEGVPVLWRPLHEAAGGWFWWGSNRESYLALWAYMHDYFTNEKGLDNLIWVWNGQNGSWYPDPDTVDIAGYDAYESNRDNPGYMPNYYNDWRNYYVQVRAWAPGKLIALTENGAIPDPDTLFVNDTQWLYFMTWDDHGSAPGITMKNNHWT